MALQLRTISGMSLNKLAQFGEFVSLAKSQKTLHINHSQNSVMKNQPKSMPKHANICKKRTVRYELSICGSGKKIRPSAAASPCRLPASATEILPNFSTRLALSAKNNSPNCFLNAETFAGSNPFYNEVKKDSNLYIRSQSVKLIRKTHRFKPNFCFLVSQKSLTIYLATFLNKSIVEINIEAKTTSK